MTVYAGARKVAPSMSSTHQSFEQSGHVSAARLREVAVAETVVFTNTEFLHMQKCAACLSLWREFIEESEKIDGASRTEHPQ